MQNREISLSQAQLTVLLNVLNTYFEEGYFLDDREKEVLELMIPYLERVL